MELLRDYGLGTVFLAFVVCCCCWFLCGLLLQAVLAVIAWILDRW